MSITPVDAELLKSYIDIVEASYDGSGNITGFKVNEQAVAATNSVADWTALQAIPKTSANDSLVVLVRSLGKYGSLWQYIHSLGKWGNMHPFVLYDVTFDAKGGTVNTVTSDGTNEKIFTLSA